MKKKWQKVTKSDKLVKKVKNMWKKTGESDKLVKKSDKKWQASEKKVTNLYKKVTK